MLRRLACLAALLALLAAPACSDDDDNGSGSATKGGDETENPTSTAQAADSSQVTMRDFAFDPKTVEVPGDGATLRLANEGSANHTFTVDSLNIDQQVTAGSQVEVPVKAPDSPVPFYCRFHRAQGMEGTLRPKA